MTEYRKQTKNPKSVQLPTKTKTKTKEKAAWLYYCLLPSKISVSRVIISKDKPFHVPSRR